MKPIYPGLFGLLAACGACGAPSDDWTRVRVAARGQESPRAFTVTVAQGEEVATLQCPSGERSDAPRLRCAAGGFDVHASAGSLYVTVRSQGNAFLSQTVTVTGAPVLTLDALSQAESTADYATRLDGDGCLGQLRELGVSFATDLGSSHAVKFVIQEPHGQPRVYFQNTNRFPLHYEFARQVLGFAGTADEFSAETYAAGDRALMAGTLVFYPSVASPARGAVASVEAPWTLNFFPGDPINPEQVRLAHRLLEERLTCLRWTGAEQRLIYVPAGATKEAEAAAAGADFERTGIGWARHADLFGGMTLQTLNPGLAYGSLKRLTPEELASSVVSYRDILLLSRIPAALPLVGGTITAELQTPLSHVNVAARTRGTPNVAHTTALDDPLIASLVGKLVRFEVESGDYTLTESTLEEAEAFWAARTPEPYLPTSDSSFMGIPSFAELSFGDSVRVGAKAANLAELSHVLGENAPRDGLAVPFHYYEQFIDSSFVTETSCNDAESACVSEGRAAAICAGARALCLNEGEPETIARFIDRVLDEPSFASDAALREATLASLRYLIERTPVDSELAVLFDGRVAELFGSSRVKLRSSSNVEDLPDFSGAGLYDSYGANGPKGAAPSVVLTKIFASAWNYRAFEERSYWNIDQRLVRMGCLVNQAFTDELANGVLITENIADPAIYGMYVNVQKGEVSVVSPPSGALPEILTILGDTQDDVVRKRYSSLSPDRPLLTAEETTALYRAGDLARKHFGSLYGRAAGQLVLDIEFKLTPEHTIVFKQARPYTTSTR